MDKIRVGVIGVGYLGTYHVQNYRSLQHVEIKGVYDTCPPKGRQLEQNTGIPACQSLDQLCQQVDAVSIAVPTTEHSKVAEAVLERGIHVLVEKPITATLAEADRLIDLAERKKAVLQVGQIERFNPAIQALNDFPVAPRFIESHRLASFNPRGTDVAVVLDLMIHDIDLALHFIKSRVTKVTAVGVPVLSATADIANARLEFEDGCVANITASRISLSQMRKMRIFQENTYLSIDLLKKESEIYHLCAHDDTSPVSGMTVAELTGPEKSGRIIRSVKGRQDDNPLKTELESFIAAVRNQTAPPVTGQEGRAALKIALDITEKITSA